MIINGYDIVQVNNKSQNIKTALRAGKLYILKEFNDGLEQQVKYSNESMIMKYIKRKKLCARTVTIKETFEYNGKFYIVMERCKEDLMDLMEQNRLDYNQTKELFKFICESVYILHCHNIVHLDIKPENIFIDFENCVKIADFDHSKIVNEKKNKQRFKGLCGTEQYRAPEFKKDEFVDLNLYKCDVWSLGVLYHTMLSQHWPCTNNNYVKVSPRLLKEDRIFIRYMMQVDWNKRPTLYNVLLTNYMQQIKIH